MSSGGKSGGANKTYNYYGTVGMALGIGPIDSIHGLFGDQKQLGVWPLAATGLSDLATIEVRGKIRLHWGRSGQTVNTLLSSYAAHPPYKDLGIAVAEDFLLGQEKTTVPSFQWVMTRTCAQSVITGAAAQLDANSQTNPCAFIAEVVTSVHGLNVAANKLHTASWQAVADSLNTTDQRSLYYCSPSITSQTTARTVFEQLGSLPGLWTRANSAGLVEMGRWVPPTDTSSLPIVTAADLAGDDDISTTDMDDLPTDYTIEFTDAERLYKKGAERVPDLAAVRVDSALRTENITAPEVTNRAQARRRVAEYIKQRRGGATSGTLPVRRYKGRLIRPGDYFFYDIDPIPDGSSSLLLMRCLRRRFGPTGPVRLEVQSDPGAVPVAYVTPSAGGGVTTDPVIPAPTRPRMISLKPYSGEAPSITALVARPEANVIGLDVMYDQDTGAGTFPEIGTLGGFALPVTLPAALTATTTTVQVKTFATFADGRRADRDRWILSDGNSVGLTEAADDRLVLILLRRDPSTGQIRLLGTGKAFEVMSISAVSLASADTWNLTVLRGRLGTTAITFNTADGATFPDAFNQFEGWIIPSASIERLGHADFAALTKAGTAAKFRLRPFSRVSQYDPSEAYAAGLQGSAAWTDVSYTFPPDDLKPMPGGGALTGVELLDPVVTNSLAAPSISPSSGLFATSVTLSISAPNGAVVRYSTTGDVTASSTEWPTSGGSYTTLTLASSTTLRVKAYGASGSSSEQVSQVYTKNSTTEKVATPTIASSINLTQTPPIAVQWNLACATSGATIQYRTTTPITGTPGAWINGSTPSLQMYPTVDTKLEARAIKAGMDDSDILTVAYSGS